MNKEFTTYEQTLALKELGFDEESFGHYRTYGKNLFYATPIARNLPARYRVINAPLYQQAFRWFREKYKLQHHIWSGKINSIFYGYDILNIEEQEFVVNNSDIGGGDCDYDTYEEAEKACLDKLIEIVKNKS